MSNLSTFHRVENIHIILFVASKILDKGSVVVTQWQSLGAAEIEKDIAIYIDNVATHRLLIFKEGVNLRGLLISANIILAEERLIPRATEVDTRSLCLGESSVSRPVFEKSQFPLNITVDLSFDECQHFTLIFFLYLL